MIDAEGEQTQEHGHQGLGAWARRGVTDTDRAADPALSDPPDTDPPSGPTEVVGEPGPLVPAEMPPLPAWMGEEPAPLPEPAPGSYTDRGEQAEQAAFLGDGVYSGGEYAGGEYAARPPRD